MTKNKGRKGSRKSQKSDGTVFNEMNKGLKDFDKDFDKNMAQTGKSIGKSVRKFL